MLTVAICDDEEQQRVLTEAAIHRFLAANKITAAHLESFATPLAFLDYIDSGQPLDIAFLDVCMPGLRGTEVAREIRAARDNVQIVFLTVSPEYAVDAFALHAAHYLVKPFTQAQFDDAMHQALGNIEQEAPANLVCHSQAGSVHLVRIDCISYIDTHGRSRIIHVGSGEIAEEKLSLGGLLEELERMAPGQFTMPYRGFIVNQKAIRRIEPECIVLKDDTRVPIARRGYRKARAAYFDFMFGSMGHE